MEPCLRRHLLSADLVQWSWRQPMRGEHRNRTVRLAATWSPRVSVQFSRSNQAFWQSLDHCPLTGSSATGHRARQVSGKGPGCNGKTHRDTVRRAGGDPGHVPLWRRRRSSVARGRAAGPRQKRERLGKGPSAARPTRSNRTPA